MYDDFYDNYNYIRNNNSNYGFDYPMGNSFNGQYRDFNSPNTEIKELENSYPEIYKIVYPMVSKVCTNCPNQISRNTVDEMTNEIYLALESIPEVNDTFEVKKETRSANNSVLKDLIRILILRELLTRPGGRPGGGPRPPRPQFPPYSPRPHGFPYL